MKLDEDMKNLLFRDRTLIQKIFFCVLWIGCFVLGWQAWGLFTNFFSVANLKKSDRFQEGRLRWSNNDGRAAILGSELSMASNAI